MRFGNVDLECGIALAPMAGFSDYAMRRIAYEMGAEYSVTEMVSAKAVVYNDKKTKTLAHITKYEAPTAIQIFGSEPSVMAEAAGILSTFDGGGALPVAIDINMGCPVHKIFSNGEGSALMRSPELIYDIVKKEMAKPSNLLEHVAGRIVKAIAAEFPQLVRFSVTVSKRRPPVDGIVQWSKISLDYDNSIYNTGV